MGGGNSRMMLENKITNSIENNVNNHVDMVNKTSQNVTQSYIDKVQNSTEAQASILQITTLKNIKLSGNATLLIDKKVRIASSIIARNTITSNITDRTALNSVMSTALENAVESQAEMDTSQKAVNVMEQMDQNNGGVEGVINKLADTVTNVFGGGNTDQDVKNILDSSVKMNTSNNLNMENVIETNVNKEFKADTNNQCKSDIDITQITEMEDITISDNAKLIDTQDAELKSTVECFNDIFNIRDIGTGITAASGSSAENTLTNISTLKSKQDANNKLKQTKLQKNFLDSLGGSCGMCLVIILVVFMGMGKGGGGGGGEGGEDGEDGGGMIGWIIGFFIILFIGVIIYLCVEHKDAFKGTALGDAFIEALEEMNPSARFYFEETNNVGIYKIFTVSNHLQLVVTEEKEKHASVRNIEERPDYSRNLEFRSENDVGDDSDEEEDNDISEFLIVEVSQPPPTTSANSQEIDPPPKQYKIYTRNGSHQLGFLYSDKVRDGNGKKIVEPIFYNTKTLIGGPFENQFVFTISPELDVGNPSSTGNTLSHVNKDTNLSESLSGLSQDMVGYFNISDKPLNGGTFRKEDNAGDDYAPQGAEFRFD
jgi:hypothetical protein